jgi:transposase-like protein
MARSTVKPKPPPLSDAQLDEIERAVRASRASPIATLFDRLLSPGSRKTALASLAHRGLEVSTKFVRLPLVAQIEELVEARTYVLVSELPSMLRGVTKANEVKTAVAKAVSRAKVSRATSIDGEVLVFSGSAVLSASEAEALREQVSSLVALVGAKPRRTAPPPVLSSVESIARRLEKITTDARARWRRTLVLSTLRKLEGSPSALVPTATLVRAVRAQDPAIDGHTLLALAQDAVIELRPDSGLSLLSDEDRALCPRDPSGTALSYVRRSAIVGAST